MPSSLLLVLTLKMAAGLLADRVFGEARRFHPLVGFGRWAGWVERACRRLFFGTNETGMRLAGLLAWALAALKLGPQMTGFVFLLINIYLGFEVSTLKRWMLERTGWQALGVVTGKSIAECERRFFESWLPAQPIIAAETAGPMGTSVPPVAPRRGSRFWPFSARH